MTEEITVNGKRMRIVYDETIYATAQEAIDAYDNYMKVELPARQAEFDIAFDIFRAEKSAFQKWQEEQPKGYTELEYLPNT